MLSPGAQLDATTRLRHLVERGGEAEVWLGEDIQLGRDVAIKILPAKDPWGHADATAQEVRAWREARAVARLLHPSIAAVYHVGIWRERPYLVMEWVEGVSLRERLAAGPIDPRRASTWLKTIGHAVQHAHDNGVVHCDLKPENILVRPTQAGRSAIKLIDFGLARGQGLPHRSPVQVRGTKGYLPPEAGVVTPSPAGDQFALAVIAVELLGGSRPHLIPGHLPELPPLPSGVPANVWQIVRRAMATAPADRFPDVATFIDALSVALPTRAQRRPQPAGLWQQARAPLTVDEVTALPTAMLDLLVLALQGVVQRDELLDRCLGGQALQTARNRLVATGALHEREGTLRPIMPSLSEDASTRVPAELLRRAHAAIAQGIERGDLARRWVAEEAATAWLRAGCPTDAARCLGTLAVGLPVARHRVVLLERAAHLTAAGAAASDHADACVQWGLAAARCGLRRRAEAAMAAALGARQVDALGLTTGDWRLRASIRELRGDARSAAEAWDQAAMCSERFEDHARAQVGKARALLRAGDCDLAAALTAQQAADASGLPSLGVAAARTTGVALERAGKSAQALVVLRAGAADALCLGEPLQAAGALLTLGEALRRVGRPDAARLQVEEAADALAGQAAVAASIGLALLQGRVALDEGQPWRAWAGAQRAVTLAEELALRPQEQAGWRLAQAAAERAGQPTEARAAALQLARLRKRAGKPALDATDWWVDLSE